MEWHGRSQFALNCRIARIGSILLSPATGSFPRHGGRSFVVDTATSRDLSGPKIGYLCAGAIAMRLLPRLNRAVQQEDDRSSGTGWLVVGLTIGRASMGPYRV